MAVRTPERESPRASATPAVEVDALGKVFSTGRGPVEALAGVGFAVAPGDVTGIVGPSGCGKSTLLEIVAGLQEPSSGHVRVHGRAGAAERLRGCVLMPQRDLLLPWRSALDNAGLARELRGDGRKQARRRAAALFERFGLEEFASARPHELSGGMRQRVAFARTLLAERPLLLLDEPFGSLDEITRGTLNEELVRLFVSERFAAIFITHSISEAVYLSTRLLVMSSRPGRIVKEFEVPFPYPRSPELRFDPDFGRLAGDVSQALREGHT